MSDNTSAPIAASSKKAAKKEEKKSKNNKEESLENFNGLVVYSSPKNTKENLKVILTLVAAKSVEFKFIKDSSNVQFIGLPAMSHQSKRLFGASSIVSYVRSLHKADSALHPDALDLLYFDDFELSAVLNNTNKDEKRAQAAKALEKLELHVKKLAVDTLAVFALYPTVNELLSLLSKDAYNDAALKAQFPQVIASFAAVHTSTELSQAKAIIAGKTPSAAPTASTSSSADFPPVTKATLPGDVNWHSCGLLSSLKLIFDAAITAAVPESVDLQLNAAVVLRCGNATFGDFQCNNAMALSKAVKGIEGYKGPVAPKDIAERIIAALPENPIISSSTAAPNGFVNIKLTQQTLVDSIAVIISQGLQAPQVPKQKVLVDFSSPNIAKEMHVGHLRSTIIGDCICRLFEFIGFDVMRVNHVGDWGTQFGMLITYLLDAYPTMVYTAEDGQVRVSTTDIPNITDLTLIYKESKKRFDADEIFKDRSRKNVVSLQSGDPTCRAIWQLLCDISRAEFEKIYTALDVRLTETGESFYNPLIPGVIDELNGMGLVQDDEGMRIIKLPHFTIPLILRKSDGGYGYDSTDMAALKYRIFDLQRDWIVAITDAGQAPHFHMCFDAAREAGWVNNRAVRLDHIGFGLVCGDDGKRFKTRSSETVRLLDLLNAAKERMVDSLKQRIEVSAGSDTAEGAASSSSNFYKSMTIEDIEVAAKNIGYGAVKYFDLKQHPSTNYIFSYDRMLDTKGDTAVYLLFAYARLTSILRKAQEERNIDIAAFSQESSSILLLEQPTERALAFELLQFGDMIKNVIHELLPNRLCDYLKEVSVKFTDFVTKCHVLNNTDPRVTHSRLLLCEATRRTMQQCFSLLGIKPVDRL